MNQLNLNAIDDQREIISDFYDTIKDRYPNVSLKQILEVCRAPFGFIKQAMQMFDLPEIRIKYLGVFKVEPYWAKTLLNKIRISNEKNPNERKEQLINSLTEYLVRNPAPIYQKNKKQEEDYENSEII